MANVQTAFGFRHVGYLSGGAPDYQLATRLIASSNTTAIYFGDPVVKVATTGYIAQAANNTTTLEGIFYGCTYTPTTGGPPVWAPYYPGSAAGDVTAYIMNAPNAVFLAATLNTAIVTSNIGANVGFNVAAGSTFGGGFSGFTLDQATATTGTTNTLPFQILALYPGIGNGSDPSTPYNWVEVTFNNERFKQLTGVL